MAEVPLADRVVEVIADFGVDATARFRYGSGCIVRGRTILTVAHLVAGASSVSVRDADKREYPGIVDHEFVGDTQGPRPDLALLTVDDPAFARDLPPMPLGRLDRNSSSAEPVERCHAVGYPWFAEDPSPMGVRESVDAIGVVPALSRLAGGLLSVIVSIAPRALPSEQVAARVNLNGQVCPALRLWRGDTCSESSASMPPA